MQDTVSNVEHEVDVTTTCINNNKYIIILFYYNPINTSISVYGSEVLKIDLKLRSLFIKSL